jgi:hypothetical protein
VPGFLRVLRFPLPIIPPTAPHSASIIRGWYNRPVSGRRTKWTQSHPTPRHKKNPNLWLWAEVGGWRLCGPVTPGEESPLRGPACPRADLDRWRREKCLPLPGIEPRFPSRPASVLVTVLPELSRLYAGLVTSLSPSDLHVITLAK